jgi:hypothetical protein
MIGIVSSCLAQVGSNQPTRKVLIIVTILGVGATQRLGLFFPLSPFQYQIEYIFQLLPEVDVTH